MNWRERREHEQRCCDWYTQKWGVPYAFSLGEVIRAYKDCLQNKRNTRNAKEFEIDWLVNCRALCDEINFGEYEIGKSITFVVTRPKLREVFAADFRDRVVHHLVINELLPYFEEEFITETYSCRVGKGVLYGIKSLYDQIKDCTENYIKDAWCVKMDLRAFFMSIPKDRLAERVDKFIEDKYPLNRKKAMLKRLCRQIILHRPETSCEKKGDLSLWRKLPTEKSLFAVGSERGLPIGNLTSQIFANFYLSPLDHYIKEELNMPYYGRYVDDLVIVSGDKEKLKKIIPLVEDYVTNKLGLTMHKDKRYMQHYKNGVPFIGAVLKPGRVYVKRQTYGNLYGKMKWHYCHVSEANLANMIMTTNSYLGYLSNFSSYRKRRKILTGMGLYDPWEELIEIDANCKKITDKRPKCSILNNKMLNNGN